jgi:hypothetical protein
VLLVEQKWFQRFCKTGGIPDFKDHTRFRSLDHLCDSGPARADDRTAAQHRLQACVRETFLMTWNRHDPGLRVKFCQCFICHLTSKTEGHPKLLGESLDSAVEATLSKGRSHEHQFGRGHFRNQTTHRLDQ